jgi:hypothetical protein
MIIFFKNISLIKSRLLESSFPFRTGYLDNFKEDKTMSKKFNLEEHYSF